MGAWENWYHCTAHTYGTWLRGDPRGWRSRDHREHVDGDYKHPPPKGKYDDLHALSKSLMQRDPVRIEMELRQFVVDHVVKRLIDRYNPVDIASFDAIHLHVLVRCDSDNPRVELGAAKQFATAQLKANDLATSLD